MVNTMRIVAAASMAWMAQASGQSMDQWMANTQTSQEQWVSSHSGNYEQQAQSARQLSGSGYSQLAKSAGKGLGIMLLWCCLGTVVCCGPIAVIVWFMQKKKEEEKGVTVHQQKIEETKTKKRALQRKPPAPAEGPEPVGTVVHKGPVVTYAAHSPAPHAAPTVQSFIAHPVTYAAAARPSPTQTIARPTYAAPVSYAAPQMQPLVQTYAAPISYAAPQMYTAGLPAYSPRSATEMQPLVQANEGL